MTQTENNLLKDAQDKLFDLYLSGSVLNEYRKKESETRQVLNALPELERKCALEDFDKMHSTQFAKVFAQTVAAIKDGKLLLSRLSKWNDIRNNPDIKIEYVVQGLIPKGSITLLFGRGGIGKTTVCLQIAKAVPEGILFGNLQTQKMPVYYIDFENPLPVLKERAVNIGEAENVWIWHLSNNPMPPRLDSKEWELYKQLPPGLIFFDTLRAAHLSDENKSQDMAIVIARLKELRELGFTILLLHHTPKGNENIYKGSTALLDLVDYVLGFETVKDTDNEPIEFDPDNLYKLSTRMKTRYGLCQIFLKFNPERKVFDTAKDPEMEKLEEVYGLLKDKGELATNPFCELIKKELDITSKGTAHKLIKKGKGLYWEACKQGHVVLYHALESPGVQPIYSQTSGLSENSPKNISGLLGKEDIPQTRINTVKSTSPDPLQTSGLSNNAPIQGGLWDKNAGNGSNTGLTGEL